MQIEKKEVMSITQVSARFGASRTAVWRLIKEGKLQAQMVGSKYYILTESAERVFLGKVAA